MLFCRKKKEITGRNKETVKNSTESRKNRAAASGSSPGAPGRKVTFSFLQ
ncbi:hypothetical protein C8D99_12431 [Aminivibrio pyruvatiphilus]|jgi:hypothetical protein|uniref:Uncharacterized protein n=1 Tax=Aminivibrio pyruvatiphilus TaxID=1005740 RepID=A0A4R8M1P6_9BACT|nr:hypothetical protein C8D99_12431 [Aminivibrio pyruvatiphilus]